MSEESLQEVAPSTQHYSSSGINSAEQEESYQVAEYDRFFNSEDPVAEEDISAYTLTDSDAALIVHQLDVTNGLLGTQNAILIIFAIFGVMRFIMRLINHNIFNYI